MPPVDHPFTSTMDYKNNSYANLAADDSVVVTTEAMDNQNQTLNEKSDIYVPLTFDKSNLVTAQQQDRSGEKDITDTKLVFRYFVISGRELMIFFSAVSKT